MTALVTAYFQICGASRRKATKSTMSLVCKTPWIRGACYQTACRCKVHGLVSYSRKSSATEVEQLQVLIAVELRT